MVPFRMFQYPSKDEVPDPEFPTMHKPFVVAPERLVVACISDCGLPSPFVDKVDIVSPELFLQGFIESLDPW